MRKITIENLTQCLSRLSGTNGFGKTWEIHEQKTYFIVNAKYDSPKGVAVPFQAIVEKQRGVLCTDKDDPEDFRDPDDEFVEFSAQFNGKIPTDLPYSSYTELNEYLDEAFEDFYIRGKRTYDVWIQVMEFEEGSGNEPREVYCEDDLGPFSDKQKALDFVGRLRIK